MRFRERSRTKLKNLEGFSSKAYMDAHDGWTIGWGRMHGVNAGDTTTADQEEVWMHKYLLDLEKWLVNAVKVPLTDQQHDALMIFAYNIGRGAFKQSTALRKLNAEDYEDVPVQLARWIYDDGDISPGLMIRRAAEIRLWQSDRV